MSSSDSRSLTLIGDYLEIESRSKSELKEILTELNGNVQKKLWHQVSLQLLSFLSNPLLTSTNLLSLQENVVVRCYKKLAPFEYARWSIAIANMVSGGNNVAEGLKHMESVLPHVLMQTAGQTSIEQDDQAVLLIQLEILRRQLALGTDPDTIKERLNDCKKSLDHFSGVMDARVYASFYQASYEYSKVKASLASDIGLAALLGKNIYNFGELLQNPILKTLDSTEYVWLPKMLQAFNQGNIKAFNDIFGQVKDKYPTLAANVAFLNQKLRIMTLMELVFRLPSGSKAGTASGAASASSSSSSLSAPSEQRGRFLTFDAISKGCDLPVDQVEWLLMKSLALKVIKGEIDQVDQSIRLTWVSPRVLDIEQVKSLKNRLSVWQQEVEQTTVFVENNAQQII